MTKAGGIGVVAFCTLLVSSSVAVPHSDVREGCDCEGFKEVLEVQQSEISSLQDQLKSQREWTSTQLKTQKEQLQQQMYALIQVLVNGQELDPTESKAIETDDINDLLLTLRIVGVRGMAGQNGKDGRDGLHGRDGRDGLPGAPGIKGDIGSPGDVGKPGYSGSQGLPGQFGAKGDTGKPGVAGVTGNAGPPGPRGLLGPPGSAGVKGAEGLRGPQGSRGSDGSPGSKGAVGPPGPQGRSGTPAEKESSGGVYTRWGRTSCGHNSALLYKGFAGGVYYAATGGGSNYQCMPLDPQYNRYSSGESFEGSFINGAEYQSNVAGIFNRRVYNQNVPCARCYTTDRGAVLMIPAKRSCPGGWNKEYEGYLMTARNSHSHPTTYECVDNSPLTYSAEYVRGMHENIDGALFYFVRSVCSDDGNTGHCPPYYARRELTCVVCSK